MTLRDITALTIKVSGIVLFIIVVARMPEYFKDYLTDQSAMVDGIAWRYIVPLLIPSIAALLLVLFPYSISDKVVFAAKSENEFKTQIHEIEIVAIRILGLLLLYWAISDAVFHATNFMMLKPEVQSDFPLSAYNYPYMITTVVEAICALWLLVGTRQVVYFLTKIRRQ